MIIRGVYYDGKSTASHPCNLRVEADCRVSVDGVNVEPCDLTALHISPRVGNAARRITFPGGALFETRENDSVDKLISAIQPAGGFNAFHFESSPKYILLSAVLFLLMLFLLFTQGIPALGRLAADRLPTSVAVELGDRGLSALDEHIFSASDLAADRQQALTEAFESLVPTDSDFYYHLLFRNGRMIGANALALPDGTIIVTDQFVALVDDVNELKAVLLHEIGHVEHRHALRSAVEAAGTTLVMSWLTENIDAVSNYIFSLPALYFVTNYSREHEWQADTYALDYMLAHGMDPKGFSAIMRKLEDSAVADEKESEEGEKQATAPSEAEQDKTRRMARMLDYFQTHPPTHERIERFDNAVSVPAPQ